MNTKTEAIIEEGKLDFLWLELTSRCNLRCVHCYAESEPLPPSADILKLSDYQDILKSAATLGCRQVQFIGGEPTLFPDLRLLIEQAHRLGYDFIEVFTNATRINDDLLNCFVTNKVNIAVSFYSHKPDVHDEITQKSGSHAHTLKTIIRFLAAGLQVRAGIIVMPQNKNDVEETKQFLTSLGVQNIGLDRVRAIGRGDSTGKHDEKSGLTELCGSCWKGSVCVSPDGTVSPCIMSKKWNIGSVMTSDFGELVRSAALQAIRKRIYNDVWVPEMASLESSPTRGADECYPNCNPRCSPSCDPINNCNPRNQCNPNLYCGPCYPGK